MQFLIKLAISVTIIIVCTQIGRKLPTLAGLIAVMPLTGAIVLVWLCSDNPGNLDLIQVKEFKSGGFSVLESPTFALSY